MSPWRMTLKILLIVLNRVPKKLYDNIIIIFSQNSNSCIISFTSITEQAFLRVEVHVGIKLKVHCAALQFESPALVVYMRTRTI